MAHLSTEMAPKSRDETVFHLQLTQNLGTVLGKDARKDVGYGAARQRERRKTWMM